LQLTFLIGFDNIKVRPGGTHQLKVNRVIRPPMQKIHHLIELGRRIDRDSL
jgi:hypothetical protein